MATARKTTKAAAPAEEKPAAGDPVVSEEAVTGAAGEVTATVTDDESAEDSADSADESTDESAGAGTDGLIVSKAAPLEAPPVPARITTEADEQDNAPQYAGNLGAEMVRNALPSSRLVDQATNQSPDPDTLFAETEGPGVLVVCTVRLCQDSWIGPHENPIRQLVMPAGQVTGPEKAAQILAVLREQIAADEAAKSAPDSE